MAHSPVRHLSLDLWLTLIRSNPAFKPARNALFQKTFDIHRPQSETEAVFRNYDRLFNAINENTGGNLTRAQMLYIILAALGKDATQIPLTTLEGFFAEADRLFFRYPPALLESGIGEALHRIKDGGITVSLLSNTAFITGAALRQLLSHNGLEEVLCFQIYSDECGWSKPSAAVFNLLWQKANAERPLEKTHILHVGDNRVADLKGAAAAGMQSLLFDPEKDSLSQMLTDRLCTPLLRCTI